MKYLDALRIIQNKKKTIQKTFKIYSSVLTEPLDIFIKAFYIKSGINIIIKRNQFDTLSQNLINNNFNEENDDFKIIILFPWDFHEGLNWRKGVNIRQKKFIDTKPKIDNFLKIINRVDKKKCNILYFDSPIPETLINPKENYKLKEYINFSSKKISKEINLKNYFDLEKYIDIGCPFNSLKMPLIAKELVKYAQKEFHIPFKKKNNFKKNNFKDYELKAKKILATDFDGVLWKGIIGEDGPKNIYCGTDVKGFMHNYYQDLLLKLKNEGVLLIGITKNTIKDANTGLNTINCKLKKKDFVKIFASYKSKSSQLISALKSLNLSQEHVLFIDDNDIEIADVKKNLPKSLSIKFPTSFDKFSKFIREVNYNFSKNIVTKEDRNRLINYKEILKTTKIFNSKIINLDNYLKSLNMNLTIKKKSAKNFDRAIQLINKTNQFNLNGIRLSKKKILKIISNKGNLITGSYKDNISDYGEIIAILIDKNGKVLSFVMSCRVFQRKIEHAFIFDIVKRNFKINELNYIKTDKNEPIRNFIFNDLNGFIDKKQNFIDKRKYIDFFKNKDKLFKIKYT